MRRTLRTPADAATGSAYLFSYVPLLAAEPQVTALSR
jgi:hypothetical protein